MTTDETAATNEFPTVVQRVPFETYNDGSYVLRVTGLPPREFAIAISGHNTWVILGALERDANGICHWRIRTTRESDIAQRERVMRVAIDVATDAGITGTRPATHVDPPDSVVVVTRSDGALRLLATVEHRRTTYHLYIEPPCSDDDHEVGDVARYRVTKRTSSTSEELLASGVVVRLDGGFALDGARFNLPPGVKLEVEAALATIHALPWRDAEPASSDASEDASCRAERADHEPCDIVQKVPFAVDYIPYVVRLIGLPPTRFEIVDAGLDPKSYARGALGDNAEITHSDWIAHVDVHPLFAAARAAIKAWRGVAGTDVPMGAGTVVASSSQIVCSFECGGPCELRLQPCGSGTAYHIWRWQKNERKHARSGAVVTVGAARTFDGLIVSPDGSELMRAATVALLGVEGLPWETGQRQAERVNPAARVKWPFSVDGANYMVAIAPPAGPTLCPRFEVFDASLKVVGCGVLKTYADGHKQPAYSPPIMRATVEAEASRALLAACPLPWEDGPHQAARFGGEKDPEDDDTQFHVVFEHEGAHYRVTHVGWPPGRFKIRRCNERGTVGEVQRDNTFKVTSDSLVVEGELLWHSEHGRYRGYNVDRAYYPSAAHVPLIQAAVQASREYLFESSASVAETTPEAPSRVSWDTYFLNIARVVATRSTCLRVPDGVGCVLVAPDKKILATGYAGSLRGQPHCTDAGVGCLIDPQTTGCIRTVHAEQNAIIQAAQPLAGATAYVTLSPCVPCFKMLAQAGVRRIVYAKEYRTGVDVQRQLAAGMDVVLEAGDGT